MTNRDKKLYYGGKEIKIIKDLNFARLVKVQFVETGEHRTVDKTIIKQWLSQPKED